MSVNRTTGHLVTLIILRPWSRFPHYVNLDENCAFVIYGGAYINRKCSIKMGYICEKRAYGFMGKSTSLCETSSNTIFHDLFI